eukprot:NODE_3847_length_1975_cov_1.765152.p1 GENE.NODE_3847_length_1975_cov_1.765152~~NODE_3847_length_1975_cov_1.765152.p1  ORF type:complete len:515 (-),score=196.93 NODE_3847_length_1975_cov_1.765152:57-1601(-)
MAAFSTMRLLLEEGADPRPVLSELGSGHDAAVEILKSWSAEKTEAAQRARLDRLEVQLKEFSAKWTPEEQRRYYIKTTKHWLQSMASSGDVDGIKELLEDVARDEAKRLAKQGDAGAAANDELPLMAEVKDLCGRTLLHLASWKGQPAVVEMLLTHWKVCASATDNNGASAGLLRRIFRVDVDARFGPFNGCGGWTAFAIAAHMGHADVIEVLRRHGANPLLGTEFHRDAFAVANALPPSVGSEATAVIAQINDYVVTTVQAHGFETGATLMYKCNPASQKTIMTLTTDRSKGPVPSGKTFCARVHNATTLTLYANYEDAMTGKRQRVQRVSSGEGTWLVALPAVQTCMLEHLMNARQPGLFLTDRACIQAPVRSSQKMLEQAADTPSSSRRPLDRLFQAKALDAKLNLPGGFNVGTRVRLSAKGLEADEDYDWSEDPMRPGEVGRVYVLENPQESAPGESAGASEVCVVGPRGDSGYYDAADIERVDPAPTPVGPPIAAAPARASVKARKPIV